MEIDGCPVPDDLRVEPESGVWVRPGAGGLLTLGLMAPFLAFAGRLTQVTFRPLTGPQEAGRSVATVESVRLTGPVRLPLAGEVQERNEALLGRPRLANDAPYGEGWFVRVRPTDPAGIQGLPTPAQAAAAIRQQIIDRRVHCWAALPDLEVYEIGAECRAILVRLDDELAAREDGTVVLLVVDDPTAPIEMVRWSDRTGHRILEQRRADGLLHFLVRKSPGPPAVGRP